VGLSQPVSAVKQLLGAKSGLAPSTQQLFVMDDNRKGVEDFSLKSHQLVQQVMEYTASDTELQLAVMTHLEQIKWEHTTDMVMLSEEKLLATKTAGSGSRALVTSGIEIIDGTHYFEVEWVLPGGDNMIGMVRPGLDHTKAWHQTDDAWFIHSSGRLYGNGKYSADPAEKYDAGDRVGILVDVENKSMRFFRNGVLNGPGYEAGKVTGPLVLAMQSGGEKDSARLILEPEWPKGSAQVAAPATQADAGQYRVE
jgi:hypothetical protein